ncbi:uncharacterized protein STEHIDRAFT_163788 [Stereum hirsutum FP-91666 SS1]|uniref:Uncharacterized protein n=1 Tax=Stereum hirsutum (strain FP-91666) TaxID=721885 RepID=R7RWT7_STEHR|nr:uncharacterized protein STEHIDRAFT_163788 [Stereum hirsutum FP-91666 SS1]EIM79263.1 hypothetical protein STEHIDRAFT_163788 [Stereum hirsutum FP-91666 SS1]
MDDLGVCTHNLCRENPGLCQIFYPADDDRQLARNPSTLPRAKCMFCGHVAAIHKRPQRPAAAGPAPGAQNSAQPANAAPSSPHLPDSAHQRSHFTASEPSPTQSTLFNSRPSTGKKYSQPPPSTHPTSSSPSNSSYNFGFDANAFKSHANVRTDRAAQSDGHTAPQDPSPPSPTPQPQSYADRAADRADHMGNNRAAHKAGQPIRASKLGQKYYPSQDVTTEAETNGPPETKKARDKRKRADKKRSDSSKASSSKSPNEQAEVKEFKFKFALLPEIMSVHAGTRRVPSPADLTSLDIQCLIKSTSIFSNTPPSVIATTVSNLFQHVPEMLASKVHRDSAHATRPSDPTNPFASWVLLVPKPGNKGAATFLTSYPANRKIDLDQLLQVVSATNIRNAARAWPNLVLIALLPGQPDIGTSGKGAARDEVSDGDDEVEEVDQDGEEHSAEGASEDEEDVDENDEIGDAQPKKRSRPSHVPSHTNDFQAQTNPPKLTSAPHSSTTKPDDDAPDAISPQHEHLVYLIDNIVEPARRSSMWPLTAHELYQRTLSMKSGMDMAYGTYYGHPGSSHKDFDRDVFWNTFVDPFLDSLGFLRALATNVLAIAGDQTPSADKCDHEVASVTKFGPHGLHTITEGLSFAYEFLPDTSISTWYNYRLRLRDLSTDVTTLIHNFYHAHEVSRPERYAPIVYRNLLRTIEQCDKRGQLNPATVQDWKKLRVAAVNEISSVEDIREALAHDFGIPDSTGHMVVVVERLLGGEWGISRVVVRTIFDALYNLPWWYRWDRGELRTVLEAFCGDVLKALQALPKTSKKPDGVPEAKNEKGTRTSQACLLLVTSSSTLGSKGRYNTRTHSQRADNTAPKSRKAKDTAYPAKGNGSGRDDSGNAKFTGDGTASDPLFLQSDDDEPSLSPPPRPHDAPKTNTFYAEFEETEADRDLDKCLRDMFDAMHNPHRYRDASPPYSDSDSFSSTPILNEDDTLPDAPKQPAASTSTAPSAPPTSAPPPHPLTPRPQLLYQRSMLTLLTRLLTGIG